MRELFDAKLARFAAVGVANTVFGLASIYGCKYFLGMDDVAANAAGYAAAVLLAFLLNRHWTFVHQGPAAPAFLRYLAVLAVAYAANLLAVLAARDALGWNGYVAQLAGVVPYAAIGYLGSRWFAFRQRPVRRTGAPGALHRASARRQT
jgi:putative flippase GtrA